MKKAMKKTMKKRQKRYKKNDELGLGKGNSKYQQKVMDRRRGRIKSNSPYHLVD